MLVIGAAEKTRTSTPVKEQRPQRCASTNSATAARDQVVERRIDEPFTDVKGKMPSSKRKRAENIGPFHLTWFGSLNLECRQRSGGAGFGHCGSVQSIRSRPDHRHPFWLSGGKDRL